MILDVNFQSSEKTTLGEVLKNNYKIDREWNYARWYKVYTTYKRKMALFLNMDRTSTFWQDKAFLL